VLLGDLDRAWYWPSAIDEVTSGSSSSGLGGLEQRLVERAGAVGGELVEAHDRRVVGGVEGGLVGAGVDR
jgi:hypothetical protein